MAASPINEPIGGLHGRFPTDPVFYRQVLHYLPSPVVVVNSIGEIFYANDAMVQLGGWEISDDINVNIMSYVHPQDRDAIAAAFVELIDSPGARMLGSRPWAEIYFRIVTADGTTVPVEVVGTGGVLDEHVGGIIYEVRPALTRDLFGRILDGLSQGQSMHHLLSLVTEMIVRPPLDLEAAILQSTPRGNLLVAASTSPVLTDLLTGSSSSSPWHAVNKQPAFLNVRDLPHDLGAPLQKAGLLDLWHLAVESPLTASTLRIVAASPTHHVPANGPVDRLIRARELASAVLLRTQTDVLLSHAAAHDSLTDLPNRAAFYQLAEALDPDTERAALHLDLDGLKNVNDALGAASGDAVLQVVADRLRATCSPNDVIARVGDDEFTVLRTPQAGASSKQGQSLLSESVELASEVLDAVADTIVIAGRPMDVTTSIGVAVAGAGISTDHLLTWADAAMHDAKRAGGGQIRQYNIASERR